MNGDTTQRIKAIIKERYDTFMRIYINHIYWCEKDTRYWASIHLTKAQDNRRICPICGEDVNDVTFTYDAQLWYALARPDLTISGKPDLPMENKRKSRFGLF